MKSFTLDLLRSDEEVHYRDYRINGHKFAFDQIQYNKGGPHNMERIAVPVIGKSDGKPVANLETTVILVECGNIYTYLGNGIKHELCMKFVQSGYDLGVIDEGLQEKERQE